MNLALKAKWLRRQVFEMTARTRQGHLASVLSEIEILIALYYGGILRYTPGNPDDPDRDRVIVSKGHATMGLYPILANIGYFPESELDRYGTFDGMLRIFGNTSIPGIDATTGSLGHGIGIACGYCLAARHDNRPSRTFVVLSEGEMYEGSVWESALFASHHHLDNLIVVLDRNRKIILGDTEECVWLDPVPEKWRAFGWDVIEADGHNHDQLLSAFSTAGKRYCPTLILANTIKGKGISFMEDKPEWHYTTLTDTLVHQARKELA